jgi:hypothetical protein
MSKKVSNTLYGNKQLFVDGQLKNIDQMSVDELYGHFKSLYVLAFTDEFFDNENFDNLSIFETVLQEKKLENYYKNVCLIRCPFKVLSNDIIRHSISIINIDIIKNLDHKPEDQYNDYTLVAPIFTISKSDIKLYLSQFKNYLLDDYFKIKFLNYYFGNVKKIKDISYMIDNCDESLYWSNYANCKLNISIAFMNRNFNFIDLTKIEDKKLEQAIETIRNLPEDGGNYLSHMFRKQNFVDASNAIKKDGYLIYRMSPKKDLANFSEIISKLHQEMAHDELMMLLVNVMISKEYCHLILNDAKIMELFVKLSPKYYSELNIRKIIAYGWLSLYLEETIRKSFSDVNDRFVFSADVASKLPTYGYNLMRLKDNPYFPFLVNTSLYEDMNVYGIDNYSWANYDNVQNIDKDLIKSKYGVADIETFKLRLNVFMSGSKSVNLFKYVNFDNIAISGSVMSASMANFNPLIFNTDCDFNSFVDEYYSGADLDVMCNIQDTFEYIDKAHELNDSLDKMTKEINYMNVSVIEPIKNGVIFLNFKKLEEIIVEHKMNCTVETFKDNLQANKQKFYILYVQYKIEQHKKYFDENHEKYSDPKYNGFFEILPIENIEIFIKNFYDIDEEENNSKYIISEGLKFKIKVSGMKRHIELFQIKYPNFFSTVHKFHLPCVRSYYDGKMVYMLPSAVTAYMTLTNIDYKYFAGKKDPIEVINKYRHRGYGTLLNDRERIKLLKYSYDVEKWRKLYDLRSLAKKESEKIFKPIYIKNMFFRPLKMYDKQGIFFNKTNYHHAFEPIITNHGYVNVLDKKTITFNFKDNKINDVGGGPL